MNYIHYTGYDAVHSGDFVFDIPDGYDCYLLVVTSTPAKFCIEGVITEYPPHYAILYPPHHKIWYGASAGRYGDDWIRFSSDEAFVRNFPLMLHPFPVSDPDYCHRLFQLLTWETSLETGASKAYRHIITSAYANPAAMQDNPVLSQLLRILFFKLRDDVLNHTASAHDHELLALRRQISGSPQLAWNIREMAQQLHMSMGHLQLLYKQKFGISCMDDVIDFRLRKAQDLLAYTEQSVAEVAEQCGYKNVEHFYRQFRKYTGIAPGMFKKRIHNAVK